MNLSRITNKKNLIIYFSIAIVFYTLINITSLNVPVVNHDEFGYWANAAFFAGKDWSSVTLLSPYYSFGYSMILAPLFYFINNPIIIYKASIILNGLFYLCSFYISIYTIKRIFIQFDNRIIIIVCGVVSLYSANIFNLNVSWVEPLIYLVYWATIAMLLKIQDKPTYAAIATFAVLLFYLYVVHQRTIGIVFVGIIVIITMYLNKDINIQKLCAFFFICVLLIIVSMQIKQHLVSQIWDDSLLGINYDINDYSGQINKIIDVFTSPIMFVKLIRAIIGKYLYLTIASASLLLFGIRNLISITIKKYRDTSKIAYVELFLFFSLLSLCTISSLFFIYSKRLDTIFYGRYNEFSINIIMIYGILFLISKRYLIIKENITNVIFIILSLCFITPVLIQPNSFLLICTTVASLFYNSTNHTFNILAFGIFGVVFSIVVSFMLSSCKKKFICLGFFILVSVWGISSNYVIRTDINVNQDFAIQLLEFRNIVFENNDSAQIYYLWEKNEDLDSKLVLLEIIQFLLPNSKIEIVDLSTDDEWNGYDYLIAPESYYLDDENVEVIGNACGLYIYSLK